MVKTVYQLSEKSKDNIDDLIKKEYENLYEGFGAIFWLFVSVVFFLFGIGIFLFIKK